MNNEFKACRANEFNVPFDWEGSFETNGFRIHLSD